MKWIFRVVGLLVVIVAVAVVSILFLPADRVARIAAEQLRGVTGRDVSITGDVALTFWPVLGVRAGALEVGNADWAEQGPMLEATNVALGVDAMALLQGEIRVTNIEAESPTIRLEQRADGRASWVFTDATGTVEVETQPAPSTAPAEAGRSFSVEQVKVTDATLIYDAEGSDLISYEGVDLTLDWPERLGPAEISAVLRPTATPVSIDAVIGGFAGFIAGETQTIQAAVETDAGALNFNGRGDTGGAVAGDLTFKTGNTDAFLRALGLPGADLADNLGRQVDLSTALTLTPDLKLALRDLVVGLGINRITGAADIALMDVPQVNAQLDVGNLVLTSDSPAPQSTASSGGGGGGGGAETAAAGDWPKTPIDASGLAAFNGEIVLTAQSVDLGQFDLGATRALLRNEQSRMVFELRDVAAYGGNLTGEFVVNNRRGLSVGGNLAAQAIQMQPLLGAAADLDRLTGQGNARLSFLGSGGSVDAIMRSLSGDGSVQIGRGTIQGIDLDRLMRSGDSSGGTTVFDSLGGTWSIASGVLSNSDLLLQLKNYQASGKGTVGLGTQTIDYTVTPVALRANSGQGVSIPVRFTGPWSNISIRPDLEAAFEAEIDAKTDELENKAKEKINERLGISTQEGQSTEDAIKDQVKDQLLRKLFD